MPSWITSRRLIPSPSMNLMIPSELNYYLFLIINFKKNYFFACREVIQQLIDEYKAMEEPTYLDDFGEEDENN